MLKPKYFEFQVGPNTASIEMKIETSLRLVMTK